MTIADVVSTRSDLTPGSTTSWVAALGAPQSGDTVVAPAGRNRALRLRGDTGDLAPAPATAQVATCGLVFDGVLYNRADLDRDLGPSAGDAERVARAYLRWGADMLARLKGQFAIVLWDGAADQLFCARDRMGITPVYYAAVGDDLFVSTSLDALVAVPSVPGALNRAALADRLCGRWVATDETYYAAVNRLPAGHAMRRTARGVESYRYWDPAPLDRPMDWVRDDAVERFDDAFDRAVSRCLDSGPAGIFLSGGLDSVSIAALAAENSRVRGYPVPLALSLAFPDPECNEETVQRGVANDLGLPQVMTPFDVAAGRDGLLMSALELSRTSEQPLLNFWLPAYMHLAAQGRERGCTTILTGSGGDEWLGVSSYLAADLITSLDFRALYELWRTQRKSYTTSSWSLVKDMVWHFGGKPILTGAAVKVLDQVMPSVLDARKRQFIASTTPDWLAPDPELRREVNERAERHTGQPEFGQFYLRTMKRALGHLLPALEVEETYDAGRRLGQRKLSPYWDADLVELLFRIPPDVLNRGGRSKGLVRQAMARRFPHLGFASQKKVVAVNYFASVVQREWQGGWDRLGGVPTLARLGIVDPAKLESRFKHLLATQQTRKFFNMWDTINLEVWARERS
ncbi:MAG TPA: asparagine synthase-related protein [Gemmatimonadaceae bacterium]|nr:asparagine synthase-related protein [Gemmatimonadaceae bacterium]